ncbi:hypothetical protein I4U23_017768 [Adineta vaga]|nr:hypothetical protein I4U23_017768 [Adineta vaga]
MYQRAHSMSRLRGTTPGRETTPSIYDYGPGEDSINGGGFSSRLNVYSSDLYAPTSRSSRALSVARFKDINDEIIGTLNEPYDRYHRAQSTSRYDNLKTRRPYSTYGRDSSLNHRFNDSVDRVSSLKRAMRDVDYSRELRQLRCSTPSTYSNVTCGDDLLNRAREEVRRTVESRAGGSTGSAKLNNPRDYFGRTYVQYEKDGIRDVGVKYNGLSQSVHAKPSTWKAEDIIDMAYEIQAMNDDTVDKLYENQMKIKKNRQWLLEDKAGVAPRMYHFDINTRQARRDVDNALRLIRNLKELKNETFNRLSEPWKFSSYA